MKHTPAPVPKRKCVAAKPEEPPVKNCKQMTENKVIVLDPSCCHDIAKEDTWAIYGRCKLTTVDKSIIIEGIVFVVFI